MQRIRFATWAQVLQFVLFLVWSVAFTIILKFLFVTLPNAFGANVTVTRSLWGSFILFCIGMVVCALVTYLPPLIPPDDPSFKRLRAILLHLDTEVLVLAAFIYFFVDLGVSPQLSFYFSTLPTAFTYIGMGIRMIATGLIDSLTPPNVIIVLTVIVVASLITRARAFLTVLQKEVPVGKKGQQQPPAPSAQPSQQSQQPQQPQQPQQQQQSQQQQDKKG